MNILWKSEILFYELYSLLFNFQEQATAPWVPISITVSVCSLAMCLSFFLPETFGQKLPDTFSETKQILR